MWWFTHCDTTQHAQHKYQVNNAHEENEKENEEDDGRPHVHFPRNWGEIIGPGAYYIIRGMASMASMAPSLSVRIMANRWHGEAEYSTWYRINCSTDNKTGKPLVQKQTLNLLFGSHFTAIYTLTKL